ncbi:MAG: hypothetical protein ACD_78C00464G0003 [uncultured bacterium (gcode 4)]|uniref:Uncharacterized protein n=1 Tax=uncultured bacterium (gcode 4) TaxID=1234023 RepID=K1XWD4_9BACT|nr:MAG: hypothetical protein ACD_78C00464G0003 [uncultured bacterium (gcode 4)]
MTAEIIKALIEISIRAFIIIYLFSLELAKSSWFLLHRLGYGEPRRLSSHILLVPFVHRQTLDDHLEERWSWKPLQTFPLRFGVCRTEDDCFLGTLLH